MARLKLRDYQQKALKAVQDEFKKGVCNQLVVHPISDGYLAQLFYKGGATREIVSRPMPLDYCVGVCEDFAREHLDMSYDDINAPWIHREEPPTAGQINLLKQKGLDGKVQTRAQAAIAIRTVIAIDRNKNRLKKEGLWEDSNTSHKIH